MLDERFLNLAYTMNRTGLDQNLPKARLQDVQLKTVTPNTYSINLSPVSISKPENLPDCESWKGHFGWFTLDDHNHIPYIIRANEKYTAVRMIEYYLKALLQRINSDAYINYINISTYFITAAERRLLNEINFFHSDGLFGNSMFFQQDLIMKVEDGIEFFKFLKLCSDKMSNVGTNEEKACGFITIDDSSVVPYVLCKNEKYFPLFYFEGAEHLKTHAVALTGWPHVYLKLCFKIQGIRDEYLKHESCDTVSLTHIKECFPPDTTFKDFHPNATNALFNHNFNNRNKDELPVWYKKPASQEVAYNIYVQPLNTNNNH